VTNQPATLRVQEYRNDSNKIIWVAWSPTGEGKSFTALLDATPGRLLDAQHMPLDATELSAHLPAKQIAPSRVEVDVDESPVYLIFEQ
jgi:Mrp family chromosome partitioning ATPase